MDPLLYGTMNINGQDEDEIAFCGEACIGLPQRAGTDPDYVIQVSVPSAP